MKVLFVDACVRQESRTRVLCRAYLGRRYAQSDASAYALTERKLSERNLLPLDAQTLANREKDSIAGDFSALEYYPAQEFALADEIVIGAPYWDCSFPSRLKVYFEHIAVNGLTFGYGEDGAPQTLCHAKRLVYITTAGGYFPEQNSVKLYLQELCKMFGIPEFRFFSAQGLDIAGNDENEIMNTACEEIARLADADRLGKQETEER